MSVKRYIDGEIINIAGRNENPDVELNENSHNAVENAVVTKAITQLEGEVQKIVQLPQKITISNQINANANTGVKIDKPPKVNMVLRGTNTYTGTGYDFWLQADTGDLRTTNNAVPAGIYMFGQTYIAE